MLLGLFFPELIHKQPFWLNCLFYEANADFVSVQYTCYCIRVYFIIFEKKIKHEFHKVH